jgi:glycosyltransferase involved in cell wall biosynthesis
MKLTLHIFARNEESILEKSLRSIADCVDEIVFVDTGSSDKTIEIAREFTSNIYHFDWCDDFSKARNYTDSLIKEGYILHWDADWILGPNSKQELLRLKKNNFENKDCAYFDWKNGVGTDEETITSKLFVYKQGVFKWRSPIHNQLIPIDPNYKPSELRTSKVIINHYKDPISKSHRYTQTLSILDKTISSCDEDLRRYLTPFYCEALIDVSRFADGLEWSKKGLESVQSSDFGTIYLIDLYLQCAVELGLQNEALDLISSYEDRLSKYAGFVLIMADILCFFDDKLALALYQEFVSKKYNAKDFGGVWVKSRYQIHPNNMIGVITQNRKL